MWEFGDKKHAIFLGEEIVVVQIKKTVKAPIR